MKKRIIISSIIALMAVFLLTIIINSIFFQHEEIQSICYVNSVNKNYHTRNCKFLNNEPAEIFIWEAINEGYSVCPDCSIMSYLYNECYTTENGECFHQDNCHYIANSRTIRTTVFNAIKYNYNPCSYCNSDFDINRECIVIPNGKYLHYYKKEVNDIMSHEANAASTKEPKIKEMSESKAIKKDYSKCFYCNTDTLEKTNITINKYGLSFFISLSIVVFFAPDFSDGLKYKNNQYRNC